MSERRIINGHRVFSDVGFVVYMVSSPQSTPKFKGWLCGGTIIHPSLIITSASCMHAMSHVYAVAGYRKYVSAEKIEEDMCTSKMKKRVVSYCYHPTYGLELSRKDYWNLMDIAVARVETPFDARDVNYKIYCNYVPQVVNVNFFDDFQLPGLDVIAFGWGSSRYYRPVGDLHDNNEHFLRYTSTMIMDRDECAKAYSKHLYDPFKKHTHEQWICTHEYEGRLDDAGNLVRSVPMRRDYERRSNINVNESEIWDNETEIYISRRHGICQNDHGGPLITWVGGKPVVIGVATVFMVDKHMQCRGPYAYTSTYCNSKLINCILESQRTQWYRRSDECNGILDEKNVSWTSN